MFTLIFLCNITVEYTFLLGHCLLFGTRWPLLPKFVWVLVNGPATGPRWGRLQRAYESSVGSLVRGLHPGHMWNALLTVWCTEQPFWFDLSFGLETEQVLLSPFFFGCFQDFFLPSGTCNVFCGLRWKQIFRIPRLQESSLSTSISLFSSIVTELWENFLDAWCLAECRMGIRAIFNYLTICMKFFHFYLTTTSILSSYLSSGILLLISLALHIWFWFSGSGERSVLASTLPFWWCLCIKAFDKI